MITLIILLIVLSRLNIFKRTTTITIEFYERNREDSNN